MSRIEKLLFGFLVAMLVGVIGTSGYVVVEHVTRCDRFHFHAADWIHQEGDRNPVAHRLVECHRLVRLSRAAVRARLGSPSERFRRPHHGNRVWSYDAGTSEGLLLAGSAETLDVQWAGDGRVRRAQIVALPAD